MNRKVRHEDLKRLLEDLYLEIKAINSGTRLNAWQSVCNYLGPGPSLGIDCWGVNPPADCKVAHLCLLAQGDTFDIRRLIEIILNMSDEIS